MSDDDLTLEPGTILDDRYELVEQIARGGFGAVYRAEQMNINREVAIKLVPPEFMDLPDVVQRFEREARLASRLQHPNTITVHDYGRYGDYLFLVMELLEGEDLADVLAREHTLSLDRIARLSRQVLKSLGEAHDKNIIHRDLKPENIFLSEISGEEEFVKVVDFGIAKLAMPESDESSSDTNRRLTIEGNTVGTPTYMSPEQAAGGDVDRRSDLYALGVIMYEMACGEPPFDADEPSKLMRQQIFKDVPELPSRELRDSWLAPVVRRALEKEKDDRFEDADAFIEAIDRAIRQHTDPATTPLPGAPNDSSMGLGETSSSPRRHPGSNSSSATGAGGHDSEVDHSELEAPSDVQIAQPPSEQDTTGSSIITVLEEPDEEDDDVIVLDEENEASGPRQRDSGSSAPSGSDAPPPDEGTVDPVEERGDDRGEGPFSDSDAVLGPETPHPRQRTGDYESPAEEAGLVEPSDVSEESSAAERSAETESEWEWDADESSGLAEEDYEVQPVGRDWGWLRTIALPALLAALALAAYYGYHYFVSGV